MAIFNLRRHTVLDSMQKIELFEVWDLEKRKRTGYNWIQKYVTTKGLQNSNEEFLKTEVSIKDKIIKYKKDPLI